jgi:hypothetical protein
MRNLRKAKVRQAAERHEIDDGVRDGDGPEGLAFKSALFDLGKDAWGRVSQILF